MGIYPAVIQSEVKPKSIRPFATIGNVADNFKTLNYSYMNFRTVKIMS